MKKIVIFMLLFSWIMINPMSCNARDWWEYDDCYDCHHSSDVMAGLVGTATGVMIAETMLSAKNNNKSNKKKVYIVEPEPKCYTVISKSTGKVSQKCDDKPSAEVIYVD